MGRHSNLIEYYSLITGLLKIDVERILENIENEKMQEAIIELMRYYEKAKNKLNDNPPRKNPIKKK